jgi:hypothetical protein
MKPQRVRRASAAYRVSSINPLRGTTDLAPASDQIAGTLGVAVLQALIASAIRRALLIHIIAHSD